MRVLVTGSAGHIGRRQCAVLREAGHEIRTFDRAAGNKADDWEHIPGDLRDILSVRRAAQGMDAVVHLGALASDRRGGADEVLSINVQGTWNVLLASVEAGVERVVCFSSINALGCVGGHRLAQYLPVDDAYPHHPLSPYQLSKHLVEETCRSFTDQHGLATICLRPGWVAAPEYYARWQKHPPRQGDDAWDRGELWVYVDIRDVCEAVLLSLNAREIKHDSFLLLADDNTLNTPTSELVDRFYAHTPWKQDRAVWFANNPYRGLVDCQHAKTILGWQPKHSWRDPLPDSDEGETR